MNKDLSVGEPQKVLWRFCLPLFGSIIFQQLYNIADSFVVGKFVGEKALAAVGNSYEITLIFIAFAFGCNIGCSVIVSQLFGTKAYGEMKTAVYTSLIATGVLCAALMLGGILGCDWLLGLIRTPEEVFADSRLYLDIYVWGLPFLFLYNVATGIFSALGDSKTPFYFLAASSLANIAVDILFVKGFGMGVGGVAWATFLCQGISCVLAVAAVLARLSHIPAEGKTAIFSWRLLCRIGVIAVPSILQQSFISIGNIVIQGVINGFGPSVMAGYSAGEAEQSGDHFPYHAGQRRVQLHRTEHRGGKAREGEAGLSGRSEAGVDSMCTHGAALLVWGQAAGIPIYGGYHRGGNGYRSGVFEDCVPFLFYNRGEAGGGRGAAGSRAHGPFHGGHLHGSDSQGGSGAVAVRAFRLSGRLVGMAHRVAGGNDAVGGFLPNRAMEAGFNLRCP